MSSRYYKAIILVDGKLHDVVFTKNSLSRAFAQVCSTIINVAFKKECVFFVEVKEVKFDQLGTVIIKKNKKGKFSYFQSVEFKFKTETITDQYSDLMKYLKIQLNYDSVEV